MEIPKPSFNALLGPNVVLSGSYLLDLIHETNHASDVDIFCTATGLDSVMEYFAPTIPERVECELGYDSIARYTVTTDHRYDIVVVKDIESHIYNFDLSVNRVFYDGTKLHHAGSWCQQKITHTVLDAYFILNIATGVETDEQSIKTYHRCLKYQSRGYTVYVDLKPFTIPQPAKPLSMDDVMRIHTEMSMMFRQRGRLQRKLIEVTQRMEVIHGSMKNSLDNIDKLTDHTTALKDLCVDRMKLQSELDIYPKDTQPNTCSICMERYDHPHALECGHVFCRDCIRGNQCPNCRGPNSKKLKLYL